MGHRKKARWCDSNSVYMIPGGWGRMVLEGMESHEIGGG